MPFLERTLYILSEQSRTPVDIKIYMPSLQKEGSFSCEFSIDWPTGVQQGKFHGLDSVQALLLSLKMVAFYLYHSDFHKEGRLVWEKLGDGYGFPLSHSFQDLAQGADKLE